MVFGRWNGAAARALEGASGVRGRPRGPQKTGLGRGHATVPWGFAVRPTVAAVDGKTRFGRFGGRRANLFFPGDMQGTENVRGVPQMISDEFGQNLTRDLATRADLPKSVRSIPMDGDANHGQTVRKSENPTAPSGPDFSSSTTLNLRPEGLRALLPGFPERKFAFGPS